MITYVFYRWEVNPKLFHNKPVWVYKGKIRTEDTLTNEELVERAKHLKEFSMGWWKVNEFRPGLSGFEKIDLEYVGF